MATKTTRNTTTARICPTCQGAGEVTVNHSRVLASGFQDPQHDEPAMCPNEGCVDGWIRFAAHDPLETLARLRRYERKGHVGLVRIHGRTCTYSEVRAQVMRPVEFPIDDAHLMVSPETAAYFNALVREQRAA